MIASQSPTEPDRTRQSSDSSDSTTVRQYDRPDRTRQDLTADARGSCQKNPTVHDRTSDRIRQTPTVPTVRQPDSSPTALRQDPTGPDRHDRPDSQGSSLLLVGLIVVNVVLGPNSPQTGAKKPKFSSRTTVWHRINSNASARRGLIFLNFTVEP